MGRSRTPVVGLLGGVGSGKSTVADALADLGAVVIDADRIGHEVLLEPGVRDAVAARWGADVCSDDGDIDRARLARIVFAQADDRTALQELEAILHPRITTRMQQELARLTADPAIPLVVLDAPMLLEAGWDRVCDALIYVHASDAVRLGRVQQTRYWDKEELDRRERMQKPLDLKRTRADFHVDNGGMPDDCRRQVERLFFKLSDDRHAVG